MASLATPYSTPVAETRTPADRIAGVMLIVQFVLMLTALFVLGGAINWPASLDEPAATMLPLIVAQAPAVALGYTTYFVSALLLAPIALLVYHRLHDGPGRAALLVAAGFGVVASFAKLLGIVRWLVLMPGIAGAYVAPETSEATRAALAIVYESFNAYAGGVGEIIGVSLFSGLWTLLIGVVLWLAALASFAIWLN